MDRQVALEVLHAASAVLVGVISVFIIGPLRDIGRRLRDIEIRLSFIEGRLSRSGESPGAMWPEGSGGDRRRQGPH